MLTTRPVTRGCLAIRRRHKYPVLSRSMDAAELRQRAIAEADELEPEPADAAERDLWRRERWGAIVLLCGLADDDDGLLRQAADNVKDSLIPRSH